MTAIKNMVRAGELVRVDTARVPGSRRPMVRYALNTTVQDCADSVAACTVPWLGC